MAQIRYLTHNEYVESRNKQDQQLHNEFAEVRASIHAVQTDLHAVQTDLHAVQTDLHAVKNDLITVHSEIRETKESVAEFKAETVQLQAFVRNNRLKNPTLPIHPVVRWDKEKGERIEPKLFPRNAKEFYSLREPLTRPLQQMLLYLVAFYDIRDGLDAGQSDEEGDKDENLLQNAERSVEQLEGILGLDEDNFNKFKQRAEQMAAQSQPPAKRIRIIHDDAATRPYQSRKLEFRVPPEDSFDEDASARAKSEQTRLLWGSRSTPSSQRPTIHKLRAHSPPPPQGLDSMPNAHSPPSFRTGSPTNPNTSPRSSRVGGRVS